MNALRACCFCALFAATTAAQPAKPEPVNRPFAARRLVSQFDFEPGPAEVFEIPRYWDLAQDGTRAGGDRPGFPAWNSAVFDSTQAFAGRRSVKLTTRGGSTSLRIEPGVIPVFPGTDYLASARIRTDHVENARAAIRARYLDKTNAPIPGSERRSDVVRSERGEWTLVTVPLSGAFPTAAYIQIDLELLQPEQFEEAGHAKHQVWPQDFIGSAWFDQVAVVQLPRAVIATSSPTNVIRHPDRPKVSVVLRDLTGEQITGAFTLQDASGNTVDSLTRNLGGGAGVWEWEPKVDRLGWYRATLELRTNDRRVGATYVDLVWLPAPTTAPGQADYTRFGVIVEELPLTHKSLLPSLVAASGAGAVSIPVWSQHTTPQDVDRLCQELVPVVDQFRAQQRRLTFSLPRLPAGLAVDARLSAEQVAPLFAADEKIWGPYLTPLLDKFGQSVQRWRIGDVPAAHSRQPVSDAPSIAHMSRLAAALSTLVPGPVVELPWQADRSPVSYPRVDAEMLALLPAGFSESGITDLVSSWGDPSTGAAPLAPRTIVLEGLSPDKYSRMDSCISLAKQAVLLWAGREGQSPPALAIPQPWDWPSSWRGESPLPHAELAAWSNLADRLRGRRAAGRLTLRPGVSCIILAPEPSASEATRPGSLILWADSPSDVGSTLDLYLGDADVEVVDLFGNTAKISPVSQGSGAGARTPMTHRIPVSEQPLFVENVDVNLAVFAASFKLDPPFASISSSEQQITMVLANAWKDRIEGRITVLEPGGLSEGAGTRDRSWRISPRTSTFSMSPRESTRLPILIAFSAVEEAGPKDFLVEIELVGTKDYAPIRLRTPLEIGVSDFVLDLSYRIVNADDIAVEAQVINRGRAPANYELSGFADGFPRGKAYISELPVGALATRRFSFPGGAAKLKGQKVRVGVQDVTSQSRLTRSILID